MFAFISMAVEADLDGAADFREALGTHQAKEIAIACHVPPSQVTKWLTVGNIPDAHKKELPPDVRRRLEELRAKRAGAIVVERDLVDAFFSLVGWRPVSASLAPADCGALSRRMGQNVAA